MNLDLKTEEAKVPVNPWPTTWRHAIRTNPLESVQEMNSSYKE